MTPVLEQHAAEAILHLAQQFRGTNFEDFLQAACAQLQISESLLFDILEERTIGTAMGATLDVLGEIVGQRRVTLATTDTLYRLYIKARIKLNRSSGTAEEIINIFSDLLPASVIKITEYAPAAFEVTVSNYVITDAEASLFASFLSQARAAGIGAIFEYYPVATANIFELDAGPGFDQGTLANGVIA